MQLFRNIALSLLIRIHKLAKLIHRPMLPVIYFLLMHFWFTGSLSAQTTRQPAKRVPLQEYSVNALRNSHPNWTLSQSNSSFTGLDKNRVIGAPYASTSHYLRQLMISVAEKELTLAGNSDRVDRCIQQARMLLDWHCYHYDLVLQYYINASKKKKKSNPLS